jgi:hypothetical protein
MMQHFTRLHEGLDTAPMLADLAANPALWNEYRERSEAEGTPHVGIDDIYLRYRPRDELTRPEAWLEPHTPAFYPAWWLLPSMHNVVWSLMATCKAVQLGAVLITRIPPGGRVLPHIDHGWSPNFYNRKVYCVLTTNARCVNLCLDEEVCMRTGELWTFKNTVEHSIENNGASDRVSLIVTMRCEGQP